jgi:hypothetical protein
MLWNEIRRQYVAFMKRVGREVGMRNTVGFNDFNSLMVRSQKWKI